MQLAIPPLDALAPAPVRRLAGASGRERLTVLFDRDCGVCQETIRILRRWDRGHRLDFVPLQEAGSAGRPILERLAAEQPLAEALHVVDETSGEVDVGGHAALAILDVLPGGWLLRPWAALPSTGAAVDVVYRLVARHRDEVSWLIGLRDDVACPTWPGGRHERPRGAPQESSAGP